MYRDDSAARQARQAWLSTLRIATPCPASWDGMVGDDRARQCALCDKKVYDVSKMTSEEAVALLAGDGTGRCARIYRRRDGTVITSDCTVGQSKRKRRLAVIGAAAGVVWASVIGGVMSAAADEPTPRHGVGEIDWRDRFDGEAFLRAPPEPPDPPELPDFDFDGVGLMGVIDMSGGRMEQLLEDGAPTIVED